MTGWEFNQLMNEIQLYFLLQIHQEMARQSINLSQSGEGNPLLLLSTGEKGDCLGTT